jgi:pimeloyl-ACP methyl ester carboxylesterase
MLRAHGGQGLAALALLVSAWTGVAGGAVAGAPEGGPLAAQAGLTPVPAAAAALPTTGRAVPELAGLDAMMGAVMTRWSLPGGQLAVARDGRLVLNRGYGLGDVEGNAPVEPTALFRIASTSKPTTVVASLGLVEQGRLSLDDRAFRLLDDLARPNHTAVEPRLYDVTIRDILQHIQVVDAVRDPAAGALTVAGGVADQLAWRACATTELPTRECAEFVVPLSYREPQGATISLAVARVPASDPAGRLGSLFLNPGGPGQPGFEELPIMYAALPAALPARFDIVGFDPRGVGESAPVRCFASAEESAAFFAAVPRVPVDAAEEAALLRSFEDLGRRCSEANADLLPHLSTFNVAQDLDRLRQAVGDQRLTYWGVSYGTYLGATYANLFPDRIRAIVLDGVINPPSYTSFDHGDGAVVGPDTTSFLRVLSNQGSADTFGAFLEECAAAGVARCAFAAPSTAETRAKFDALLDRLRTSPAMLIGPAGTLTVTYSLVLDSVFQLLYQPPTWAIVAQALQQLDEGDTVGFLTALEAFGGPPPTEYHNPNEARSASNCVDTDNPADPARYLAMARAAEERTPDFGALWTYMSLPCPFWPAQDADRYRGPWDAPTSAPLLLLSRRFDPATPHGGAVAASHTLANARLLTIDGWGHGYYLAGRSTCADEATAAYFIDRQLPAAGAICPEDAPPFGD